MMFRTVARSRGTTTTAANLFVARLPASTGQECGKI